MNEGRSPNQDRPTTAASLADALEELHRLRAASIDKSDAITRNARSAFVVSESGSHVRQTEGLA
jgi:hypothetical protein